jgi:hypothetical protein
MQSLATAATARAKLHSQHTPTMSTPASSRAAMPSGVQLAGPSVAMTLAVLRATRMRAGGKRGVGVSTDGARGGGGGGG